MDKHNEGLQFKGFIMGSPVFTSEGVKGVEITRKSQLSDEEKLMACISLLSRLGDEARVILEMLKLNGLRKGRYPQLEEAVENTEQLLKWLDK